MTTLPGVRSRRHRLLVGGSWRDAATGATRALTSPVTGDPFGGWAGKASSRGRVGGRYIFESMTQVRSVAVTVGTTAR